MAREIIPGWLAALAAPVGDDVGARPSSRDAMRPGIPARPVPVANDVVEVAIAGMAARDPGFRGGGTR
jgi:hypothetical protein